MKRVRRGVILGIPPILLVMLIFLAFPFRPLNASLAPPGQVDLGVDQERPAPADRLKPSDVVVLNFRVENHSSVPARNASVIVSLPQGAQYLRTLNNNFWNDCTLVDVQTNAPRMVCTKQYFLAGTYSYISIEIRTPPADWPYPLIAWAAVGNDVTDYDLGNNYSAYEMKLEGRPPGGASGWEQYLPIVQYAASSP